MSTRWLVLVSAVALSACVDGVPCVDDSQCAEGHGWCDVELGICIASGDAGTGGGHVGGGGGVGGGIGAGGGGGQQPVGGGGQEPVGGGAGGGTQPYCASDIRCAGWQECQPTESGGECVDAEYVLSWEAPAAFAATNASSLSGKITVSKTDGGLSLPSTVPVAGPDGATVEWTRGTGSTFEGTLTLSAPDGDKAFVAGWADGGATEPLTVSLDTTAPEVVVTVESGPVGGRWLVSGGARVHVEVKEGGVVLGVSSVSTAWGGGVTVSGDCVTTCGAGNSCACFEVALSGSKPKGLTNDVDVKATVKGVKDAVGNEAAQLDGTIRVTRLRWTKGMTLLGSAAPVLPLAVTEGGLVVWAGQEVATNGSVDGGAERLVALNPDGTLAWKAVGQGTVTAGPVVGPANVWVATSDNSASNRQLEPYAVSTGAGGPSDAICVSPSGGAFVGDLALADVGNGLRPIGMRESKLWMESNAQSGTVCLPDQPRAGETMTSPTLVVNATGSGGVDVFLAHRDASMLWKTQFSGSAWIPQGSAALPGGTQPRGLFWDGAGFVGGGGVVGNGNMFATAAPGVLGASTDFADAGAPNSGPPVVGTSAMYWGATSGDLKRLGYNHSAGTFSGTVPTAASASGDNLQDVMPVLGEGGLVYAAGKGRTLRVYSASNLTQQWTADLGAQAAGQMALDAYRKPNGDVDCSVPLGVLYVTTKSGATATLHAILVDSKGLDGTAPWPKYQRDNGNRGNASSPASPGVCGP